MNEKEPHSDNDELKKIAPMLFSLKKDTPFKVPVGYFDELPMLIQERVVKEKAVQSIWVRISNVLFRPEIGWGSTSIAMLVLIGLLVLKNENAPQPTSMDIAEVVYHEEIDNINEEALIEALQEENLSEIESKTDASYQDNDEVIIEYLLDNKIDEADIINELNSI